MKDDQTKVRKEELIKLVSSFFDKYLNEEYKELSIKLVKKLGRKHDVPFKRGKLENWASGIIYTIAQINFLFDKSQSIHTSPDEICDFYKTKKSTASDKARNIRKMLNLKQFDDEFSSNDTLSNSPIFILDERTGFIIPFDGFLDDNIISNNNSNDNYVDLDALSNDFKLLDEWMDINSEEDSKKIFDEDFNSPFGKNEYDDYYEDLFDKSFELSLNDKIFEAIELIDTVPKDSSEYGRALFYKSVFKDKLGDYEESSKLFKKSLKLLVPIEDEEYLELLESFYEYFKSILNDDESSDTELIEADDEDYFDEGLFYFKLKHYEEAIFYFEKSLKYNPNQSEALYYIATSLNYLEELEEALEAIDKAIKIDSNDERFWNEKANILTKLDKFKKAEECYNKAIELNPKNSIFWSNKGFLYKENSKYDKALDAYDKAIELNSKEITYILGKVQVYLEIEDFDKAKEFLDLAKEIDSENIDYLTEKGFYMLHIGKYKEAIKFWDKCLEKDENLIKILIYKVYAYHNLGDEKSMNECIKKAYEIDPITCVSILESIIEDDE